MDKSNNLLDVNFETMKVRLEFLYRLVIEQNIHLHKVNTPIELVEMELSSMITGGLAIIWKHRSDSGFTLSPDEHKFGLRFGKMVTDRFNVLSRSIQDANGLPITIRLGRVELLLQEATEEVIAEAKTIIEEKEVSNG